MCSSHHISITRNILLRENESFIPLLRLISNKVLYPCADNSSQLQSSSVSLSCIDACDPYLAIGTNSPLFYIFNKYSGELLKHSIEVFIICAFAFTNLE